MKYEYTTAGTLYPSLEATLTDYAVAGWRLNTVQVSGAGYVLIFERKVIDLDIVCQE